MCDRVRLEHTLRAWALEREGVTLRDGCEVLDLEIDHGLARVLGVSVRQRGEAQPRVIPADVIVDATGRGTRAPQWLSRHGFGDVETLEVRSNVGYTSRVFHVPGGNHHLQLPIVVFPDAPRTRRAGLVFAYGDDGLLVALAGWCRDYVPRSAEGFLKFARLLERPELARALLGARPSPSEHSFRARANLWRRYDRLRRWPDGLVVLGDAISSLNPLYGQGMTVAAMEAEALAAALARLERRRARLEHHGGARRLQRRFARIIRFPWLLVTSEDLRYAATEGPRPRGLRLLQRFTGALHGLVAYDRLVHERVLALLNLTRSPLSLLSPRILLRVALHRLRGDGLQRALRRADTPIETTPAQPTPALAAAPSRRVASVDAALVDAAPVGVPRPSAPTVMKRPSLSFQEWRAARRSGALVRLRRAAHLKQLAARASARAATTSAEAREAVAREAEVREADVRAEAEDALTRTG